MDFFAIIRNESLHNANLEDIKFLSLDVPHHEDTFHILMMYCETGKTVKKDGKPQYGRVIRHKDPFRCPVVAQGLYLLDRFDLLGEFFYSNLEETDDENFESKFESNKDWFDIKVCDIIYFVFVFIHF